MGDKLLDQIFNLKFTSKQLVKQSHKCEKDEKAEKLKVKKAIEKGNIDGAKIYAQVCAHIGQPRSAQDYSAFIAEVHSRLWVLLDTRC